MASRLGKIIKPKRMYGTATKTQSRRLKTRRDTGKDASIASLQRTLRTQRRGSPEYMKTRRKINALKKK